MKTAFLLLPFNQTSQRLKGNQSQLSLTLKIGHAKSCLVLLLTQCVIIS